MQHSVAELSAGIDLASLWHDLCHAELFIRDTQCSGGRCFALIERRADKRKPCASHLSAFERILLGESQKVVASELGVSPATVAGHSMSVLAGMTTRQLVSRVPIVMVMAVFASRGFAVESVRYETENPDGSWVISVAVPGETFRDRLSTGEWEIARLSIEGLSHSSMAVARGTSTRTIANQLGAAFTKLRVSGRGELRAKAVRELGQQRATTPPFAAPTQLGQKLWPLPSAWRRDLPLDLAI